MADPKSTIQVNVDPRNPGQFFACCGMLELADRLWPGAEGWFANGQFHIACDGTIACLLAMLVIHPPEEVTTLENGLDVKSLIAPLRFSFDGGATTSITLDAWVAIKKEKGKVIVGGNPPWNFWSGNQTSSGIWASLRVALRKQLTALNPAALANLFEQRLFLSGRFGFDPGPAWNAFDVGFSPNEHSMKVESSAAVELLAAVGIQRFRPKMDSSRDTFVYATWSVPLAPVAAAVAAVDLVPANQAARFRGRVVDRGQYAALTYSDLLSGGSDG